MEDIRIVDIIGQDITEAENRRPLYTIPFKLNRVPSSLWADIFIKVWNNPPKYSSKHRPGIARVLRDRIILDGTTLDEVKSTHKATLEVCVCEANRIEAEQLRKERQQNQASEKKTREFRRSVEEKAKEIRFD